jgi:hypothetical protein
MDSFSGIATVVARISGWSEVTGEQREGQDMSRTATITALPIVLANAISVLAQYSFFRAHLPHWGTVGAGLFAGALESMAVFLAYHAHAALMANDSAARLRLASYGTGLLIGLINASHFLTHGRVTVEAASVGLLSASSPWLWGIHSRRQSRDALLAAGLIEPHAVRLGSNRWLWHPVRCMHVMYQASWIGEQDVTRAIRLVPEYAPASDVAGECAAGGEHEPYNVKPGTRVTKCRKCRSSIRLPAESELGSGRPVGLVSTS